MDLRRLKTFVAVAELGTVSKAALHLRIGQPALSRQISDLQRELGLRLFDRVGRGLVLTAEGEQFLGDCRAVLGHVDVLGERVEVLRRGDRGVLKVAAPPQTIESVLSVAAIGRRLLDSEIVQCSLPSRRRRAKHCAREPRAAYLARARRGRPGGSDHSVAPANGSPYVDNRPCNPST